MISKILLLTIIPSLANTNFSFEDVQSLVQTEKIQSVEALLPRLPESLRSNFTMVHTSKSAQGSSPEAPRVLMFTADAKLILSFNGDPAHRGYSRVEMIQFRDNSKEFEFRTIDFKDPNNVVVSAKNPKSCLACHGNSPRPIWESYPHWTGVYGEDDDQLSDQEKIWYDNFRKTSQTHSRYKNLIFNATSENYPFMPKYYERAFHKFRPNNRLGKLLIRLNSNRVSELFKDSPFLKTYANTAMVQLLPCDLSKKEAFIEKLDQLFVAKYPQLADEILALPAYERTPVVLEKLLSGLGVYDWNLTPIFAPNYAERYEVARGQESIDDWVAARILQKYFQNKKEIRTYVNFISYKDFYDGELGAGAHKTVGSEILQIYDSTGRLPYAKKIKKACHIFEKNSKKELGL